MPAGRQPGGRREQEEAIAVPHAVGHEDRQTLRLAPLWVFTAVVGRYRRFQPAEQEAFWPAVEDAAFGSGGLTRELLMSGRADRDRLVREYEADGRPVVSGLSAVTTILNRLPAAQADAFTSALLLIGDRVARARGPYGQTTSREDRQTLLLVAELLEVERPDVSPVAAPA